MLSVSLFLWYGEDDCRRCEDAEYGVPFGVNIPPFCDRCDDIDAVGGGRGPFLADDDCEAADTGV